MQSFGGDAAVHADYVNLEVYILDEYSLFVDVV